MNKIDLMLTAIAPIIWGSTYVVTTQLLPGWHPLIIALLRALPAGILLLMIVRKLPFGGWWIKSFILGALNFSIFWWFLFIAAYRLPGGIAAMTGAAQPLIVIILARFVLASSIRIESLFAACLGLGGIALLILTPDATLDSIGIMAGLASAFSMAFGSVLTRRWRPPVSLLTFTAWQLSAGGILLVPVVVFLNPASPDLSTMNILGFAYLSFIGAAFTYLLWFRGLMRFEPNVVVMLGLLSPVVAVVLGWWVLDQRLETVQFMGVGIIFIAVFFSQKKGVEKVAVVTTSVTAVLGKSR